MVPDVATMDKKTRILQGERDLAYATRFLKPILSMVGVWPIPATSSTTLKVLRKTERIVTYTLLFLMLVPSLLYMLLKNNSGKMKLKLLPPIINSFMQVFKYTVLLHRSKEIEFGLETIKQDWLEATEENRLIFLSKAKITRKLVLTVAITMYSGGICYRAILPLLRGTIVTPDNITIRPLPCPTYFPYLNEQAPTIYEIVFTVQVLAGFVTYAVISGCCGMCAILILHTCSMLRILVNKMNRLVDKTEMEEALVHRKVMDIVEYQVKIKNFLKNNDKVTQHIFLVEILGGTCLICLAGYCILMEWENKSSTMAFVVLLTLQFSCTFCVYIFCYIGQFLVDESEHVSQTSCTINWYRLRNKHARCLILIIAMSHSPMKLTAGKVFDMSLTSFTDIMKLSLGYLNILREVV